MNTTTTTETPAARRLRKDGFTTLRRNRELDVHPVPADLFADAPEPIRVASVALSEALDRRAKVESDALNADVAVGQAQERDAAAVREAVKAGKKMPKPTLPQAISDQEDAARAKIAAQENVIEGQRNLALALFDHGPLWASALVRQHADLKAQIREKVEELGALSITCASAGQAAEEVARIRPCPNPRFAIRRHRPTRKAREKLDRLAETLIGEGI